ncbi:hypothetical protein ACKFKG_09350 [Phormidesmis sp. 146-35]
MTDTPAQPNDLTNRTASLEGDMLDVKVSLNRLIDVVYDNSQQLRTTMQAVDRLAQTQQQYMERTETLFESVLTRIDEMQSEVRGLQTENRRILEILSDRSQEEP